MQTSNPIEVACDLSEFDKYPNLFTPKADDAVMSFLYHAFMSKLISSFLIEEK